MNAFFIFVPYINELNFFEPGSSSAEQVMQIGILRNFGNIDFVNYLFRVIFLLTAIGLIRRAPTLFNSLISPGSSQDIFSKGDSTVKNVRATVDTVKDHVSGQYAMDKVANITGNIKNFIPGSEFIKAGANLARKGANKLQAKALELYARSKGIPKDIAKQAAHQLYAQMEKRHDIKNKQKEKNAARRAARDKERANRR